DAMRIKRNGVLRADQGESRLALTEPHTRRVGLGPIEVRGGYPPAVRHDDRSPRKPVLVVDHDMRIALSLHGDEMRADHPAAPLRRCGPAPTPNARAILHPSVEHPNQSS